ncbi:MAG: hypothetical protein ABIE42_11755 [Candidatus Eisenbacteria bacterium]
MKTKGTTKDSRERLPSERAAIVWHIEVQTTDGPLDCYVTVGLYPDGRPGELFLNIRGAGAERYSGLSDAFAIGVSIGLQHGMPLSEVTEKLCGTRAQPIGRIGERLSVSLLHAIAARLEAKFYPEKAAARGDVL